MKFSLKVTSSLKVEADLLGLFVFADDLSFGFGELDRQLDGNLSAIVKKESYTAKDGQVLSIHTQGKLPTYKICLIGLGRRDKFDLYKLRKSASILIRKAIGEKALKAAVVIPDEWFKKYSPSTALQSLVEGLILGSYRFHKYKSQEEKKEFGEVVEVEILLSPSKLGSAEKSIGMGETFANATNFARDLINEPSMVTTPTRLAVVAEEITKLAKGIIKTTIYDRDQIIKLGMGAYLGVAQGSDEPPKFIKLCYRPSHPKAKIVLAGKGITFDTGGLSLKGAEHMETMKMDMAGGAAVLAIFRALVTLKPKVEVIGMIPACENMPSGKALKPGDVLTAVNGKTIEVLNTDAEGRLTLADALSLAVKERPDAVIDMATLTGACMVALGQEIAGAWTNNQELLAKLKNASEISGEKIWPMPLEEEYKDLIKSDIADLKNTQTGRYGGAITAALFLSEFVSSIPWVHLDIAGPAYEEKDTILVPKGGAGFAVRTILQFLMDYQ